MRRRLTANDTYVVDYVAGAVVDAGADKGVDTGAGVGHVTRSRRMSRTSTLTGVRRAVDATGNGLARHVSPAMPG